MILWYTCVDCKHWMTYGILQVEHVEVFLHNMWGRCQLRDTSAKHVILDSDPGVAHARDLRRNHWVTFVTVCSACGRAQKKGAAHAAHGWHPNRFWALTFHKLLLAEPGPNPRLLANPTTLDQVWRRLFSKFNIHVCFFGFWVWCWAKHKINWY